MSASFPRESPQCQPPAPATGRSRESFAAPAPVVSEALAHPESGGIGTEVSLAALLSDSTFSPRTRKPVPSVSTDVSEDGNRLVVSRSTGIPAKAGLAGRMRVEIAAARPRAVDSPRVAAVRWVAAFGRPSILVVTFTQEMNRERVQDVWNYVLVGPRGGRLALDVAIYGLSPRSLFLFPKRSLNPKRRYRLRVIGQPPAGVVNRFGIPLDGLGLGTPGSHFRCVLSVRNQVCPAIAPDLSIALPTAPQADRFHPVVLHAAGPLVPPEPVAVDEILALLEEFGQEREEREAAPELGEPPS